MSAEEENAGMAWYLRQFERTKNPIYAVDAFVLSVRVGRSPPAAVMQWLAAGLEAWSATEGETDLSKALGLRPGSGHYQLFEQFEREREIERRMGHMDFLMFLGASRDDAALIASDRKQVPTRRPLDPPLSAETLLKRYAGRKEKLSTEHMAHWVDSGPQWVAEFLDQFGDQYGYQKSQLKSTR
jgi:hypothetical protein